MSAWQDRKFINQISSRLPMFKWKKQTLANCRCPFCGDSKKNKVKARGYFYEKKGSFWYSCHNCGVSYSLVTILKKLDQRLFKEYMLETFQNNNNTNLQINMDDVSLQNEEKVNVYLTKTRKLKLPSILDLATEHVARQYVKSRKIPFSCYGKLYFANDFKEFVTSILGEDGKALIPNEPRLIIPFFSKDGSLLAFQGRNFTEYGKRYITFTVNKDKPKCFGLDGYDPKKEALVLEGPLDSLFLPNALAVAHSDLRSALPYIEDRDNTIFVPDNERRNFEVVAGIQKCIDLGLRVCIWPDSWVFYKDINSMVKDGKIAPQQILETIHSFTFSGLEAQLRLNNWKKC